MVHKNHKKHGDKLFHKSKIIYSCPCGFGFRFHPSLIKHLANDHGRHEQENAKLICNLTPDFEEYEMTNLTGQTIEQISPISIKYGSQRQQNMMESEQDSESEEEAEKKKKNDVSSSLPNMIQKNQLYTIEPFAIRHLPYTVPKRGRPCKTITSNQVVPKPRNYEQKFSFIMKGKATNHQTTKYGLKVIFFQPTGTMISKLMVLYLVSQTSNTIDKETYLSIRQTVAVFTLLIYCEASYLSLRHISTLDQRDIIHFLNYFSTSYLPSSLKFQQIRNALQIMSVIDLFITKQYLLEIFKWIDWCNRNKLAQLRIKVNMNSPFVLLVTRA